MSYEDDFKEPFRTRDCLSNYISDNYQSHPVFDTGKSWWTKNWEDLQHAFGGKETKKRIQKIWDDDWKFLEQRLDDATTQKYFEEDQMLLKKELEDAIKAQSNEQD